MTVPMKELIIEPFILRDPQGGFERGRYTRTIIGYRCGGPTSITKSALHAAIDILIGNI